MKLYRNKKKSPNHNRKPIETGKLQSNNFCAIIPTKNVKKS